MATAGMFAQSQVGRAEQASLAAIYKNLQLSPVTLDKQVLRPNEKIEATAAIISNATAAMEVPELSKGYNGGGHIIGIMAWYVRRTDKKVPAKKPASPFGEPSGPSFVARISQIVPGQNSHLDWPFQNPPRTAPISHTLDLKRLNLESGEYELTIVLTGVTKFQASGVAKFQVDNPDQAKPTVTQARADDKSDKGADQAGKAFYALLKYGKIEIATEKIRTGLPFTAMCKVTSGAGSLAIPANISKSYPPQSTGTIFAIADYYFLRKGETKRFHLGYAMLVSKSRDKIMPGDSFDCLADIDADKFKLLTGPYELILEIRGLPLSNKDQYFAYKDKKSVTLSK